MLSTCPSAHDLLAFHRGTLQVSQLDVVAEHLESCPNCDAAVRGLDEGADPLVDVMRKHANANSTVCSQDWRPTGMSQRRTQAAGSVPVVSWPAVPGYELLAALGHGGMGVVYQARHIPLNRLVALKHLEIGAGPKAARSRVEAEALAGLHHPNIVQIHEIVEHQGGLFLSLELIDGGSLASFLRGKPQPPLEVARLIETVARAVEHAHSRGIVHRDLKPANILLSTGSPGDVDKTWDPSASGASTQQPALSTFAPKIADFGLAKRLKESHGATRDGDVIGTPSYMAPEQASGQGGAIGPAADIYSLGVILYEMVTGRVPLQGPSTLQTLLMVCESEPVPPRRIQPGLPRDLETICLKCLQKVPSRRYRSADELAEDLRRFQANEPIRARPTPLWERGWKWARRRPPLAGLILLSLGVVAIGFPLVLFLWLRADRALVQVAESRNQLENAVYAGNIALADHAVHANEIAAAVSLLDQCIPTAGRPDLRGWEWGYLRRLCRSDLIPGINHSDHPQFWIFALSFHPTGKYLVSAAGLPAGNIAGYPENAHRTTPGEAKVWDVSTGQCLATLAGHQAAVHSAAFSPDGRWLATGAADGTVRLWDGSSFAPLASLPQQAGLITSLVFAPDSQVLAVGSTGSVIAWDMKNARARYVLSQGDFGSQVTLAFSPRGDRLAAGWKSDEAGVGLKIWEMTTGTPVGHHVAPGPVAGLAFSPDGRLLALADGSDRINIWDSEAARRVRTLSTHADGTSSLNFCPDGRMASAGEDRTVRTWNAKSWTVEAEYRGHELGILCLASSPDGTRLASADKVGGVKLWDSLRHPSGSTFNPFPGNGEYLGHLAFSGDGRHVLDVTDVGDDARTHYLEIRDSATGRLERRLSLQPISKIDSMHRVFAFSGDARRLCGRDWVDRELLRVYDTNDGTTISTTRAPGVVVMAVAMNRDGTRLAQSGWRSEEAGPEPIMRTDLSIHDAASGRQIQTLNLPRDYVATQIALSPDGRHLATAIRGTIARDGKRSAAPKTEVFIWDLRTSESRLVADMRHEGALTCLAYSADGARLASAGVDHTVHVIDTRSGRPVFPTRTESGDPTSVGFSPDGRRLATAGMDGIVRLWDATTGNALLSLRGFGLPGTGHYGYAARVAFSPDGTRLMSNNWDSTVTIWETASH